MVDISYEICAILISFVILLNIFRTKRAKSLQNTVFELMVIFNGLTAAFDIAKRVALSHADTMNLGFINFCTMGYFITHVCVLPFFYIYTISLIMNWKDISRMHRFLSVFSVSLAVIYILLNPLTGLVYQITPDGTYVRGRGLFAIYLIAGFYIMHIIIILIRYHKNYTRVKRVTLYGCLILLLTGVGIQYLFPQLLVETIFNAISLLIFFFVVQNPHNQLDHNTGMFNRVAFNLSIGNYLVNEKNFFLIIVVLENLSDVSLQEREKLVYLVARYLKGLRKGFTVYRLDDNSLCISSVDTELYQPQEIALEIETQFKQIWKGLSARVLLRSKLCVLSFPCDIHKMEQLKAVFLNLKERANEENKIFTESDFELKQIVRATLVSDALVKALEENRFELDYTPVFELKKAKLFAAESNLKFLDSRLGYVYEEEIQEIAEKGGKMAHLSEWILDQTCETIEKNNLDRTRLRMIFVRLSTGLCLQYGYEDIILEIIRSHNIPPSMICFLVSEYTVSKGSQILLQGMRKLKDYGISFCLENYGSGYTNLSSLYNLPFDYIEISKLVTRDTLSKEKARVILESTLTLAKSLHIDTIVAGVNSEEQKKILENMPCDYALGSYFLGQMEKKEFLTLINDNPLNSMEGRYLVKMRMEELVSREREQAENGRSRRKKNPDAPRVKGQTPGYRKEAD